jgi:hypothetical protein
MAASSTTAAFLIALKTQLAARYLAHATLSGITVEYVAVPSTNPKDQLDIVVLVADTIEGQQEYLTFSTRKDSYRIPGAVEALGSGEDTDANFQAAMDRASLILDEVILELRDNRPQVGSTDLRALVTEIGYTPFLVERGDWIVRCEFSIEYEAMVS